MDLRPFIPGALLAIVFGGGNACQNAAPSERIERFESGQVSRRTTLLNGKKEGKMTDYYNTGALMAERFFVNNEQEGRTVIYYPSGKIKEVQHYVQGQKQGSDTLWHENGHLQFVSTLRDDKLYGYLRK